MILYATSLATILLLLFIAAFGSTASFAQKKPSALFSVSFVEASYLDVKPFIAKYKSTLLSKKK
jgi:hypothetical protein